MLVKHRQIITAAASLAAACVLISPRLALAEAPDVSTPGPPTKDPERSGFTAGLGFGVGEMHIFHGGDTRSEGPGVSVRLGYAFTQNFMGLLLVDFVKTDSMTNALLGAGAQVYVSKRVFLRLGAGLGRLTNDSSASAAGPAMASPSTDTQLGVAGHGGFGIDFFQIQHMSLDAEFMTTVNKIVGDTSTVMNLSLMLGAQWF